jgi:hypothetical protein
MAGVLAAVGGGMYYATFRRRVLTSRPAKSRDLAPRPSRVRNTQGTRSGDRGRLKVEHGDGSMRSILPRARTDRGSVLHRAPLRPRTRSGRRSPPSKSPPRANLGPATEPCSAIIDPKLVPVPAHLRRCHGSSRRISAQLVAALLDTSRRPRHRFLEPAPRRLPFPEATPRALRRRRQACASRRARCAGLSGVGAIGSPP